MARYKLIVTDREGMWEVRNHRKNTKKDIEQWIVDNTKGCGLDWRCGFMVKFRSADAIYEWQWIKDDKPVKP